MAKKKKKLPENVAGLDMSRDGDDLVIRVTGLYATRGVETASDNDTRKLAASPGRFTWIPDGSPLEHPNSENRRMGFKLTAILGKPRDAKAEKAASKTEKGAPMSQVSFG